MECNLNQVWDEYPYAVTISNLSGVIIYMNNKAADTFASDGGKELIGKNLSDCHSQRSKDIIERMIKTGTSNTYTIEKKGVKKLIHQAPWFVNGKVSGLVEISIILPAQMPHFVRS